MIDADGNHLPIQRGGDGRIAFPAGVPSCGYQRYDLVTATPATFPSDLSPVTATSSSLENEYLRVEIDEQGLVSSIVDKRVGRQVLAPGALGNRLQLHPDYPNFYDA